MSVRFKRQTRRSCTCQVRGFVQPALLLRLARSPVHGYELLDDLRGSCEPCCCDAGLVYRTLRQLERTGLVKSKWHTDEGPPRRVYQITEEGLRRLREWAVEIHSLNRSLGSFLAEYEALGTGRTDQTQGG